MLEPTYRFPVLAHWSFTVSGDPTFEELMKGLDVGLIGTLVGDLPPKTPEQLEREKHRTPPPAPPRPAPELSETGRTAAEAAAAQDHGGLVYLHRVRRGGAGRDLVLQAQAAGGAVAGQRADQAARRRGGADEGAQLHERLVEV